jgi:hypothetical protein
MTSHADHLVNHITKPKLNGDNTLHVVAMCSNPIRYHSRYRLARQWYDEMLKTPNVIPYMVEVAFGDRGFEVTEAGNPNHLQLRTSQALWHKENAINLGVRELLPTWWKYMCWCDADISFRNLEWAQETLHQLQHYQVCQPFQNVADLGFDGDIIGTFDSFAYVSRLGIPMQVRHDQPYRFGHAGFAWACTRMFFENVGGLMDFPPLGSADHHMAWAMMNKVRESVPLKAGPNYMRRCVDWQQKAFRITKGHLGFVKGRIEHNFHGSKAKRFYQSRWELIFNCRFDPDLNYMRDPQGLWLLINNPDFENAISSYLKSRQEDSIES